MMGQTCHRCNKKNHFSSVCRAPTGKSTTPKAGQIKRAIENGDESTSSDDEYFTQQVKKTVHIKKIGQKHLHSQTLSVRLNGIDIQIEPDSGADVNLMDEHQFKAFTNRTAHPSSHPRSS